MKFSSTKKFWTLLFIAVLFVAACHKSDDTEEYMEGDMTYTLPLYSLAGRSYTLTAGGITTPSSGVTYTWYSSMMDDTVKGTAGVQCTVVIPDSLALYTVTEAASATGYYGTTSTMYFSVMFNDQNVNRVKFSRAFLFEIHRSVMFCQHEYIGKYSQ